MYIFESRSQEHDVQLPSKKVVTFKNFTYSTDKDSIMEELTPMCGKNFWRVDNVKVEPETEAAPRRRGRPPRVVQGTRMVDNEGE